MIDDTKDRFRPRSFEDPAVSWINEPIAFRDQGDATVLHRWPKGRPLHAVIAETLANVELLFAQLESGVRVADAQRGLIRDLSADAAAAGGAGSCVALGGIGMSGALHRRKGDRAEREIVDLHRQLDVRAERYPYSGATRFRGSAHDIDLYLFGKDAAPAVCEVKARKNGSGFVQLEKWLGEYDLLFLRKNNSAPLVLLPWRVWRSLLQRN